MTITVDTRELEEKVQRMYRAVATEPAGEYHFELGRPLAERLGYPVRVLDRVPAGAVESFAGVGYFFDLADLRAGESVVDLGSGSGMDVFFAATQVGAAGRVVVLRPGGRLAIADIVSQRQLKDSIVCDADLWASCVGGAAQQDAYREATTLAT